jgi:hypothetical protein
VPVLLSTPLARTATLAAAVIWIDTDQVFQRGPGTLQAYNATDLARNLYTSAGLGVQVPFASPVVVNGKLYVGTTNQLVGYGLLP